ncbi:carboxypeptidase-like regulatory domain-containing protein [Allorhodopirellula solitaria]|uniref:Nickel uptake substrate-specific transmembrane region n=1 Tax=Allorhodopirellula solitaria TaxID=2527987 RepID=A0A5C5XZ49_9BACT|nr:carboxypeptidase-like regulatory domain-containing protein [Allorhodopirellula solitaria]TWT67215.1 Nickel uptake substrate-specific transmembrane region [Allorhodopirellula solitaria]
MCRQSDRHQREWECPAAAPYFNSLVISVLSVVLFAAPLFSQEPPHSAEYADLLERASVAERAEDAGRADNIRLSVRGRILDDSGQPIAGAVVVLLGQSEPLARTHSDDFGEYEFENISRERPVPATDYRDGVTTLAILMAAGQQGGANWTPIQYGYQPPRGSLDRYEFLRDEPLPRSIQMRQDVVLGPPLALEGVILDRDDRPLPSVEVELIALYPTSGESVDTDRHAPTVGQLRSTTDADGRFRFPHVPEGMIAVLMLRHPDYYGTMAVMATTPAVTELASRFARGGPVHSSPARLHLDEAITLRGKVVNRKGEPVPGAVIKQRFSRGEPTQSDAEGNFSVAIAAKRVSDENAGVNVSPLTLEWPADASYASSAPAISRQDILDQQRLTLVAEDAIEIHGQVIASDDQQLVADLPVTVRSWPRNDSSPPAVRTDAEGRFRVKAQAGRWLVTCGPKAGFDLLTAHANPSGGKGFDPQSQRIVDLIDPGQPVQLGIILDRLPAVSVHVVDADGQDVAGARICITRAPDRQPLRFTRRPDALPDVEDGTTDDEGRCSFHLPTLLDGDWTVTAEYPAESPRQFAVKTLRSNRWRKVDLTLVPGVPIQGRVMIDKVPVANARVALTDDRSWIDDDPERWISSAATNDLGEYELVAPLMDERNQPFRTGRYSVRLVDLPEFTQCRKTIRSVSRTRERNLEGDALLLKDFDVAIANGEASGRVVDESGEPIAGAVVRINPDSTLLGDPTLQGYATTDEWGEFRWTGIGPGGFEPLVVIHGKPFAAPIPIEAGRRGIKIVVPRD